MINERNQLNNSGTKLQKIISETKTLTERQTGDSNLPTGSCVEHPRLKRFLDMSQMYSLLLSEAQFSLQKISEFGYRTVLRVQCLGYWA